MIAGLGIARGVLAATPIMMGTRREAVVRRLEASVPKPMRRIPRWDGGPVGRVVTGLARRRRESAAAAILRVDLPMVLDLLGVAVGAGATPRGALETASHWGPPAVGTHLHRVIAATELGGSLADALGDLAATTPPLAPIAEVLMASARLGSSAGPALARLADETRSTLRRAAEAKARTLPVKLLFPLVLLVLPAFGLLTVAPALLSALQRL